MMPLLLASWNVAGLETTVKYIREHYGSLEACLVTVDPVLYGCVV